VDPPFTEVRRAHWVLAIVVLGLAGCASDLPTRPNTAAKDAPYVGVFTGEFVDGRPLYRFPSIEVIGSRSGASHAPGELDGS